MESQSLDNIDDDSCDGSASACRNIQVTADVHEQENESVEGSDQTDTELRALTEQVVNKQSDYDKITTCDVMDTSTEPPPNSGDGSVANEIVNFGMDAPSNSKINTTITKRRRKVYEASRPLLPRKCKARAYESLKRIAKGIVITSMPLVRRRTTPKRLNRKPVVRRRNHTAIMKGRGRNATRKRSKPYGRRPTRSRPINEESGTSISTISTGTCSTSKSDESSQHDHAFY